MEFKSATDQLAALRAREISAAELLQLHLQRLEKFNGALNAVVSPNREAAIAAAAAADQAIAAGSKAPLLGLPLTIKDAINVAGLPTTGGMLAPDKAVRSENAPVAQRVLDAGAVLLGKTNTPVANGDWQANNAIFGRSHNPWDTRFTPGGSTGGGAAAVAAGLSAMEFGSDIGGSIRIPAAFCGLFGHKPSAGLVPRAGHFPAQGNLPNPGQPLGVQGPLTRSAQDLSLAMDVICGAEGLDRKAWSVQRPAARHSQLKDYRVAILQVPTWSPVDAAITVRLDALANQLEKEGCAVQRISPDGFGDFSDYYQNYLKMLQCVIGADLPDEIRQRAAAKLQGRDDIFLDAIAEGLLSNAGQLLTLLERTEVYKQRWEALFKDVDIMLAPVNMVCAFEHDDAFLYDRQLTINGEQVPYYRQSFLSSLATMAGLPATAVPLGLNDNGLPVGVQVISAFLEDNSCIEFAGHLERIYGGFKSPPNFA